MKRDLQELVGSIADEVEARVWLPRARLRFGDYCEKNIILSKEENSDYAGPYSREMTPSQVRILEEFLHAGGGSKWDECHISKSSQAAITAHALMLAVRMSDYEPGNMVYGIDSDKNAAAVSRRFVNFLKESESMGPIVRALPDSALKGDVIQIPGMEAYFVGAGSVGQAASKPGVKLVVVDEVDVHKTMKQDGSTVHLFRQRKKATVSGKLLTFSKPRTADDQMWQLVGEGSGHRDFLPCLHCGLFQYLKPAQIKYQHLRDKHGDLDLERVRQDAHYECEGCGAAIYEKSKREMLMNGEARPTHFEEKGEGEEKEMVPTWKPGVMSAYHSDLYAQWEGSRWGDIAVDKIAAGRNPAKLRGFVQDRLGEAWKEGIGRRVRKEDVRALCGSYLRGTVPKRPILSGVFADTQDDCWKAIKMSYSAEWDFMVADWGIFLTWKNLVRWAGLGVKWQGKTFPIRCNLTDEGGHRVYEVRQNCKKLHPVFNPSKGLGGLQNLRNGGELFGWRKYRVYKTDAQGRDLIKALTYDDDAYRRMLYRTLILDRHAVDEDGEPIERDHGELMLPADAASDEDFLDELCHEFQVRKNGKNGWDDDGPNDFGDAVKMGVIGKDVFGRLIR